MRHHLYNEIKLTTPMAARVKCWGLGLGGREALSPRAGSFGCKRLILGSLV